MPQHPPVTKTKKTKQGAKKTAPLNEPLSDELMDGLLASQQAERASELSAIQPVMSAKQKKGFEYALQNPEKLKSHNKKKKGKNAKFPRMGLAERQKAVMETAGKADPFMRTLDAKGHLGDSHRQNPLERYQGDSYLRSGQSIGTDGSVRSGGRKVHAVGMGEFKNKEGMLPEMSGPKSKSTKGTQSRTGKWSEADVNPVTATYADTDSDGYTYVETKNRGAERLLHTSKNSKKKVPNGKGGMSEAAVDFNQYVTTDHYHSMVPVSAVETDYKAKNAYTPKYMDPEGKKSSLELHDEREALRIAEEEAANAPVEDEVVEPVEESSTAPEATVVEETAPVKKAPAKKGGITPEERLRRQKQSMEAKRRNNLRGRKKNFKKGKGKGRKKKGRGKRRN